MGLKRSMASISPPPVPVLEWPGSISGEYSCCEAAMLNSELLNDPVGEDGEEREK